MQTATGKSIFDGIAIGKLFVFGKEDGSSEQMEKKSALTPEQELARFDDARIKAEKQLQGLYDKTLAEAGEEHAAIFEVHQMMLEDEDYVDSAKEKIDEGVTAEYATAATGEEFYELFDSMDDEYMKGRAADVKDISQRVINILSGVDEDAALEGMGDEPVILVAEDIAPSDVLKLDKDKLLGFVTKRGSSSSHTAILAGALGIPMLIGVEYDADWDGKFGVLDGYNNCLYIEPEGELLASLQAKHEEDLAAKALLEELKGKPSETSDGRRIKVFANIGSVDDAELAIDNDAEGVGLFRTEFIYLHTSDFPTEDEQFEVYKQVLEKMDGKKVVIRTLDLGADKQVDYFNLGHEDNPAMGYRAIRICLSQPEIFKAQLRAILRAAAFGTAAIMFPMIISVDEVKASKQLLDECRAELLDEGKEVGDVEVGIMVETPASVIMADELAEEVEFFSIGTNDLTQYTLAIDRQNTKLDDFRDTHHPAVLRMIQMTVDAGHRHGCWVGICGELGADQELTETFLDMGVDELSVSPASILPLRQRIRSL